MNKRTHAKWRTRSKKWRAGCRSDKPKHFWSKRRIYRFASY